MPADIGSTLRNELKWSVDKTKSQILFLKRFSGGLCFDEFAIRLNNLTWRLGKRFLKYLNDFFQIYYLYLYYTLIYFNI